MWWFTKWHKMFAFVSTWGATDQRELFDQYNELAPVKVPESDFSWQRRTGGNILGWVIIRDRKKARRVRKFLKKSKDFDFVHEGELREGREDYIRWGLD